MNEWQFIYNKLKYVLSPQPFPPLPRNAYRPLALLPGVVSWTLPRLHPWALARSRKSSLDRHTHQNCGPDKREYVGLVLGV